MCKRRRKRTQVVAEYRPNTRDTQQSSKMSIHVVDKDGRKIYYNELTRVDKELVLTELFFQSALHSFAEKRHITVCTNKHFQPNK